MGDGAFLSGFGYDAIDEYSNPITLERTETPRYLEGTPILRYSHATVLSREKCMLQHGLKTYNYFFCSDLLAARRSLITNVSSPLTLRITIIYLALEI